MNKSFGNIDQMKNRRAAAAWLNTALAKVYANMGIGLFVTFLTAMALASSPETMAMIFGSWLKWPVMLAPLAFVFAMSFGYEKFEASTLKILFFTFAVLEGLSLSIIFVVYTGTSIVSTLFICALLFGVMSAYGYFTKRSLDTLGDILFIALIGIIIAMVVNLFIQSSMMTMVISIVGVFLFLGLTAYDTQRIKTILWQDSDTNKAIIMGALTLYLDFINLFLFLLNLLGVKTGKD